MHGLYFKDYEMNSWVKNVKLPESIKSSYKKEKSHTTERSLALFPIKRKRDRVNSVCITTAALDPEGIHSGCGITSERVAEVCIFFFYVIFIKWSSLTHYWYYFHEKRPGGISTNMLYLQAFNVYYLGKYSRMNFRNIF